MKLLSMLFAVMLSTAAAAPHAAAGVSYSLLELGYLSGGDNSVAKAINNLGQVVGDASTTDLQFGGGIFTHAFLSSGNGMVDLGTLNRYPDEMSPSLTFSSNATGINDAGQVVGRSTAQNLFSAAFVYQNGQMTQLPTGTLIAFANGANAINNAGVIVGQEGYRSGMYAFIHANGVTVDLPDMSPVPSWANAEATAINNAGHVVGISGGTYFLYADGVMNNLGGLVPGLPVGINDAGHIIGNAGTAYLYVNGVVTDLGTLADGGSVAMDINNLGQVVGTSGGRAFLYADGHLTDLNTLIDPASGWILTEAAGINDLGQIAATACKDGLCQAFRLDLVSAVPEPSTLAMLLGGLLCVGYAVRRRGLSMAGTPGGDAVSYRCPAGEGARG